MRNLLTKINYFFFNFILQLTICEINFTHIFELLRLIFHIIISLKVIKRVYFIFSAKSKYNQSIYEYDNFLKQMLIFDLCLCYYWTLMIKFIIVVSIYVNIDQP